MAFFDSLDKASLHLADFLKDQLMLINIIIEYLEDTLSGDEVAEIMLLAAFLACLIAAAEGSVLACFGHADMEYLMPFSAFKFRLNISLGD